MNKNDIKSLTEWLNTQNIQKNINKLAKKYKGKDVVIYGAGLISSLILDNYNLSKLNIIAVADIKFKDETSYKGYKAISPNKILTFKPESIIMSLYDHTNAVNFLKKEFGESLKKIETITDQKIGSPAYLSTPIAISAYPIGHYYSTVPSLVDIKEGFEALGGGNKVIEGINIDDPKMLEFLKKLSTFYNDVELKNQGEHENRFYDDNNYFEQYDALTLNAMIREFKPKRIIECGSGHSSAMILDTNEDFLNNSINCSFIEPYPDRLKSILKQNDKSKCTIFEKKVQDVPLSFFEKLEENDILFIDTSHVIKFQNDVHYLYFKILPILAKGVIIHIHDIFAGFEYPASWINEGWAWNEAYLLRAFLMYNDAFKIIFWGSYLNNFFNEELSKVLPKNIINSGGSIWLKKMR